jgi:hypothetical protein
MLPHAQAEGVPTSREVRLCAAHAATERTSLWSGSLRGVTGWSKEVRAIELGAVVREDW